MHHGTTPTIRSAPPGIGAVTKSSVRTCHTDLPAHTSASVSAFIHSTPTRHCCAPSKPRPLSTGDLLHGRQMITTYEVPLLTFFAFPREVIA